MTEVNSLKMKAGVQYSDFSTSNSKILDEKNAKTLNKAIIEAAKQDGNAKDLSEAEAKYIMEQMGIEGDVQDFMAKLQTMGTDSKSIKSSKLDKSTGERTTTNKDKSIQTFDANDREVFGTTSDGFPYKTTYNDEKGTYTRTYSADKKGNVQTDATRTYDTATGLKTSSVNQSGVSTKFSYNEVGTLLKETYSTGASKEYEYSFSETNKTGSYQGYTFNYSNGGSSSYDSYGRETKTVAKDGSYTIYKNFTVDDNGTLNASGTCYDKNGKVTGSSFYEVRGYSAPKPEPKPEPKPQPQPVGVKSQPQSQSVGTKPQTQSQPTNNNTGRTNNSRNSQNNVGRTTTNNNNNNVQNRGRSSNNSGNVQNGGQSRPAYTNQNNVGRTGGRR
jgi:hypothetical protein